MTDTELEHMASNLGDTLNTTTELDKVILNCFRTVRDRTIEECAEIARKNIPEGMYHVPKVHRALVVYRRILKLKTGER